MKMRFILMDNAWLARSLGSVLTLAVAGLAAPLAGAADNTDLADGLYAEMKTSKGTILLALEFEKTPLTVCNFTGLAEGKLKNEAREGKPFYDGLIFHRVIADFMIQGGDPEGNGRGGPGYRFADEFDASLKHSGPGILSMANSGPGSNGSQFFITHKATPWLDNKHSVFGRVVKGQDIVNAIQKDDVLEKVTILRVGEKANQFQNDQPAFERLKTAAAANSPGAKSLEEATAFLAANAKKEGVMVTASGLQYQMLQAGNDQKPKPTDSVSVHYRGTLLNGTEFDSSFKRNAPATFPLNGVIPGWTEGLQLIGVGGKARLFIPPDLAYGERGAGGVIPPNAALIFEIELLKIN